MRNKYSQVILGITAILIIFLSASPSFAGKTYKFAVLPRFYPIIILERFGPLAEYISESTGIEVEFIMPKNFSDHIDMVRKGKVLLSYQNPVVYAKVAANVKPVAIASKGSDGTRFRGIIIVRTDSGINKIEDLKGKSVSVVSLQSAGGYISQKDFLAKNDISVEIDMIASETSENKQENVIFDVYSKKTDVGFIRESALHRVDKMIEPGKIKVLAETSWLPNWVFSVHESVPDSLAKQIQDALISLSASGRVLEAAQLDGFVKPDDNALKSVRKMVLGKQ